MSEARRPGAPSDTVPEFEPPAAQQPPRRVAYVQPGQLFASAEPAEASTVLGSCVAVCLWEPRRRIGGMNHFLLPWYEGGSVRSARFGNVAVEELLALMERLGARRQDLTAKLFGGAAVIEALRRGDDHLGARNVEAARTLMQRHGIPVVAEDVLGSRGRKLVLHTETGIALVRLI